jgi:hypothetical protein
MRRPMPRQEAVEMIRELVPISLTTWGHASAATQLCIQHRFGLT